MPTRVILADDHVLVRQALQSLLEREGIQVVGEAADGQEAISLAAKHMPDVAILDIGMPILNGLDAACGIRKACPKTKSILLTQYDQGQYVSEALRAGAKGYVLKQQIAQDLVHAIHEVSRGRVYLSPSISGAIADAYLSKGEVRPDPLSARERQVVQLIVAGKSTREVAMLLGISPKTAESHRGRLMHKLDIHETASLVRYAIRRGFIEP